MAGLFGDSFDHYDTAHVVPKWSAQTGGVAGDQGIVGGVLGMTNNCLRQRPNSNNGNITLTIKNLPASYGTLYFGTRWKIDTIQGPSWMEVVRFGDAGTVQTSISVTAAGQVQAWLGPASSTTGGTTLKGTSTASNLLTSNVAAYIEVEFVGAIGATGAVIIKVNSIVALTLTNIVTCSSGNPTANQIILPSSAGGGPIFTYWDDLYVNDNSGVVNNGFDGDQRAICVYPAGAGSSTQWSLFGAATNWQCVNEDPPDDDTTYNSAATSGLVDLYTTTALANSAQIVSIPRVQSVLDCKTDDGGSATVARCFGSGGAPNVGSSIAIGSGYNMAIQTDGINPLTSAAWVPADFSSLEIGAKRVS